MNIRRLVYWTIICESFWSFWPEESEPLSAELKVTFADSVTSADIFNDLELLDTELPGGAMEGLAGPVGVFVEFAAVGFGVLATEGFLMFSYS